MPDGINFVADLSRYIGQTVTVFTTSGGQSGTGFTGVLAFVNPSFIRLITQIGTAPGCALGNCCGNIRPIHGGGCRYDCAAGGYEPGLGVDNVVAAEGYGPGVAGEGYGPGAVAGEGYGPVGGVGETAPLGGQGRASCFPITLGSVVDIPVDRIASFVHNAIGSGF